MDTLTGRRLGKYQLEALVGRGGMATVYRAHDTVLNRAVAIKVLDPALAMDPRAVERFKREAVTSANLEHPAIVRVYDVQQEGGLHYIAMRFVQGTTLRQILRDNGSLPLDAVINIVRPVAEALHYAHRHGVIHRDVKPGNILVEPDGSVLLTDFGIARAADASQSTLTQTGLVMGTADYLAPEQISGRPAEPRSDLYSLGILLYEMLTGVTPFSGETTASILYRQVHDTPPPLRSLNPRLPSELQPILDRVLAKNPTLRYADPLDMVRDLEEVMQWAAPGSQGAGKRGEKQVNGRRPTGPATVYSHGAASAAHRGTQAHPDPTAYRGPAQNRRPPAPMQTSEQVPGRRPMMVMFAVGLLILGALFLAAAGILPGLKLGAATRGARFSPPGPVVYAGPTRSDSGPDLHIPRANIAPEIDGDLSDWESAAPGPFPAPSITFRASNSQHRWEGPDDLSASFYFAWDDTNFYVAATITDNAHIQFAKTRGYDLFKGDDVEIWFDTDLQGDFASREGNGDDFQLGLSPGDFGSLGPEAVFWKPNRSADRDRVVRVASQRRPAGNGYLLEAAVPWTALGGYKPRPGQAIGFAASAGDNDQSNVPTQELMISTTPRLQWNQPLTFGNLFF